MAYFLIKIDIPSLYFSKNPIYLFFFFSITNVRGKNFGTNLFNCGRAPNFLHIAFWCFISILLYNVIIYSTQF